MNNRKKYNQLFEMISILYFSNRSIGLWDNQRYKECKKNKNKVSIDYLYKSEKNTRKYLELRAKAKNKIDKLIYSLL